MRVAHRRISAKLRVHKDTVLVHLHFQASLDSLAFRSRVCLACLDSRRRALQVPQVLRLKVPQVFRLRVLGVQEPTLVLELDPTLELTLVLALESARELVRAPPLRKRAAPARPRSPPSRTALPRLSPEAATPSR